MKWSLMSFQLCLEDHVMRKSLAKKGVPVGLATS